MKESNFPALCMNTHTRQYFVVMAPDDLPTDPDYFKIIASRVQIRGLTERMAYSEYFQAANLYDALNKQHKNAYKGASIHHVNNGITYEKFVERSGRYLGKINQYMIDMFLRGRE